jgi:hypothetical protein
MCCPQVLSRRLYLPALKAGSSSPPLIVGVDLQPMAPIEGVTLLQVCPCCQLARAALLLDWRTGTLAQCTPPPSILARLLCT